MKLLMSQRILQLSKKRSLLTAVAFLTACVTFAQLRPTNKDGINVFETPKTEKNLMD